MQAAALDREARLRADVRAVLADLHLFGVPTRLMRDKNLLELRDLRDDAARRMMSAPSAA